MARRPCSSARRQNAVGGLTLTSTSCTALSPQAAAHKLFKTLQATAARAGIQARSIEGDDGRACFIVTDDSAALTLSFKSINELAAWLVERADGKGAA